MTMQMAELLRLARKGRRAEERSQAFKRFVRQLIVGLLISLSQAFCLMIAIGVLHHEWWPAMPPIGYWWALVAVYLLWGVFSRLPMPKDAS